MTQQEARKRKTSMNGVPDPSLKIRPSRGNELELSGKRIAILGGTDGIGRALARLAASRGAEVLVVGRTFRDEGHPRLTFLRADLASMREAIRVGRALDASLDLVVFTTGIMAAKQRQVTDEGVERDVAISMLSRLAILRELAPRLAARHPGAARARVFVMGFPGAGQLGNPDDVNGEQAYDAMNHHMTTVAGNEALVLDSARRYAGVAFFGLNPGLIKTGIRGNFLGAGSLLHGAVELAIGILTPSAEQYAERILPVLVSPDLEGCTGAMIGKNGQAILPSEGMDGLHVARLVGASEQLLARAVA